MPNNEQEEIMCEDCKLSRPVECGEYSLEWEEYECGIGLKQDTKKSWGTYELIPHMGKCKMFVKKDMIEKKCLRCVHFDYDKDKCLLGFKVKHINPHGLGKITVPPKECNKFDKD